MPDWNEEDKYKGVVCGVDEAGRGPWAGPVVAGAVIFFNHKINETLRTNLDDSKKLSAKKRETLYALIEEESLKGNMAYAIGEASVQEIDKINILQATFLAMRRAVAHLPFLPDIALIDGNQNPKNFLCPTQTVIKGDAKSLSIAAASIMAKVYRDRLMSSLALDYPGYGFEKNAGYGTKLHIEGLAKLGITPEHRRSYHPIKQYLEKVG